MAKQNKPLPDWRTDPQVVELQRKVNELSIGAKPIEQHIRDTLEALRRAEQAQYIAENAVLMGKAGAEGVMVARQAVAAARLKADQAQETASGIYAELAEATEQLAKAEAAAQEPVVIELRQAYIEALCKLESALEQAIPADEEVRRIYNAISLQFQSTRFPGGCMLLRWRWPMLTSDNLDVWRRWRAEAGFEPVRSKVVRMREAAVHLLEGA